MDAPKGRYHVEEKDGRLIVIDRQTGAPASRPVVPPAPTRGPGLSPAPMVAGKGPLATAADLMLRVAVREWDAEGRAVIAWEWTNNGRKQRWDALLDERQQRRLGRALLAFASAPLLVLLMIFGDGMAWLGLFLVAPLVAWSIFSIQRLQSETRGQTPQGE